MHRVEVPRTSAIISAISLESAPTKSMPLDGWKDAKKVCQKETRSYHWQLGLSKAAGGFAVIRLRGSSSDFRRSYNPWP
eukprot:6460545-Amphidinium_carterae.2